MIQVTEQERWNERIERALRQFSTPFFLVSWLEVLNALDSLQALDFGIPARHLLSVKTQPLSAILVAWCSLGEGVEVVSKYECLAALKTGFTTEQIVINGLAKHRWIRDIPADGCIMNLDSLGEIRDLISQLYRWRLGIRINTTNEIDPDNPTYRSQFGMSASEVHEAMKLIRNEGKHVEVVHCHLHSNVDNPNDYTLALEEVADICMREGIRPQIVDCGGGFPAPGERLDIESEKPIPDLSEYEVALRCGLKKFDGIEQLWLENGRRLLSQSAVLVLTVLETKQRNKIRYLICDGGRTNHALISDWERHHLTGLPKRSGDPVLTTICGPTCMAYDHLTRILLPDDVSVGDHIVWHNAGAYHIPWETRFSHGVARIVWMENKRSIKEIRAPESFENWWSYY